MQVLVSITVLPLLGSVVVINQGQNTFIVETYSLLFRRRCYMLH